MNKKLKKFIQLLESDGFTCMQAFKIEGNFEVYEYKISRDNEFTSLIFIITYGENSDIDIYQKINDTTFTGVIDQIKKYTK